MCLNPATIINPKYKPSKKNGFTPPPLPEDPRQRTIVIPCGRCLDCRKTRQRDWRIRMVKELQAAPKKDFNAFVTLTFTDASLSALSEELRSNEQKVTDKAITILAVRRFLERYRKKYGVSLRHFLIPEISPHGRLHLHGIIFGVKALERRGSKRRISFDTMTNLWSYGYIFLGSATAESVSYCVKYMMKDPFGTGVTAPVLVSPGIGKDYLNNPANINYHKPPGQDLYCVNTTIHCGGYIMPLPRYYRLKIFSEDEREVLSMILIDNPPPLEYHGMAFNTPKDLYDHKNRVYDSTLALKASFPPKVKEEQAIDKPNFLFRGSITY